LNPPADCRSRHALFADDDFLNAFVAQHPSVRVALLLNDGGEQSLAAAIERPDDNFRRASDACRRSGLFPAFRRQHRDAEAHPAYP
jgi:non-ribosomal peptide synthetase component E (peptide arylation enzyme)